MSKRLDQWFCIDCERTNWTALTIAYEDHGGNVREWKDGRVEGHRSRTDTKRRTPERGRRFRAQVRVVMVS